MDDTVNKPYFKITYYEEDQFADGVYYIKNNMGNYLDHVVTGNPIDAAGRVSFNGSSNQRWKISHYADGIYKITPMSNTGKCLDAYTTGNNQPVTVNGYHAGDMQRWRIVSNNDGATWRFIPTQVGGKSCITGYSNNTDVKMYEYNAGSYQKWTIAKIATPSFSLISYYDQGYNTRWPGTGSSSPAQMVYSYQNTVKNYIMSQFDVNITNATSSAVSYTSIADSCPNSPGINSYCMDNCVDTYIAPHFECMYPIKYHHKNSIGMLNQSAPVSKFNKAVRWTGHKLCKGCRDRTNEPAGIYGVTYLDGSQVLIATSGFFDREVDSLITLLHELGHTMGANGDTYHGYNCVMSYGKNDTSIVTKIKNNSGLVFCSTCYNEIQENLYKYY